MRPDQADLIQYRLAEAIECISDVELLISHQRYRSATNRMYYGMFYVVLALACKYDFETSKHSQLLGWFNKEFIVSDKIEPVYGKILHKAFHRRSKGDYDAFISFDQVAILEMYEEMKLFIEKISMLVKSEE